MKYGAMENERHQALRVNVMDKTATSVEYEESYKLYGEIAMRVSTFK